MSKPKKNREKARQIKGLGNSGLKKIFFKKVSGSTFFQKSKSAPRGVRSFETVKS